MRQIDLLMAIGTIAEATKLIEKVSLDGYFTYSSEEQGSLLEILTNIDCVQMKCTSLIRPQG